jgi:hypothetical protein
MLLNNKLTMRAICAAALSMVLNANAVAATRTTLTSSPDVGGLELLETLGRYEKPLKTYRIVKPSQSPEKAAAELMGVFNGLSENDFRDAELVQLSKTRIGFRHLKDPSASFEFDGETGNFLFNGGLSAYREEGHSKGLPDQKTAEPSARAWLEKLQFLPPEQELKTQHVGGLNMGVPDGKGGTIIYEKLKTVRFSRILDGLDVEGSSRIVVHLGQEGSLAGLVHQWPAIGRSVELTAAELRSPETLRDAALKKIRQGAAKAERSQLTEAKLVLFDDGHGVIEPAYHLIVERWIRLQEDQPTMIPLDFYVPVLSKPQAQYPDMEVAQLKPDDGLSEEPVVTDVDD